MTAKRIRHGWTTTANAEAYQALLLADIFPTIEARAIPGLRRCSCGAVTPKRSSSSR